MDYQKLRTLVFEKTGIKVDATDPVFALVALNESILEETLQRHLTLIQGSIAQGNRTLPPTANPQAGPAQPAFKASRENWEADEELATQARAENPAPNDPQPGHANTAQNVAPDTNRSHTQHQALPGPDRQFDQRLLLLAVAVSVCTALLVLAGQALLWPGTGSANSAANTPANSAAGITQEQRAQLKQAEKLSKAIEKLDPKAKAQLQNELNKP
jgi:hypothetical protein